MVTKNRIVLGIWSWGSSGRVSHDSDDEIV